MALKTDESQADPHIFVLKSAADLNFTMSQIQIDLSKECKRNYFRTYYITPYQNGTCFIMASFFENDDDIDSLVGCPIIFALNADVNSKTKWDQLKSTPNAFQFFFKTDLTHNSDQDDGSQPIIRADWLDGFLSPMSRVADPNKKKWPLVCSVQMNHEIEPFILVKD